MQASKKDAFLKLEVTYRPIESLIPYARNSRTHSDAQVAQIAASIREFGWTNPVLIDAEGGIIAGHGRIMAGRKLGIKEAPCIVLENLTDAKRRAYVIADNKLALNAGWDVELLKIELGDLKALDFDLSLTGFDPGELGNLLADKTEGLTDPDAVPDVPVNPATVLGDVWILGKHRLRCGDSTSADDVAALLAGVSPHLMVTDPPYGVEYSAGWRDDALGGKAGGRATGKVLNDNKADWREAWALFPGDVAYVWHAGNMAHTVAESLLACGLNIRAQIIWAKSQFVIGRGDYHPQHEPCWYAVRKGKTGHYDGGRKQSTLWQIEKPRKSETGHGTQKPVECMKRPIENNSNPGQAVYEPFSGSGTTIIAAEMTGRIAYAMELSPQYVDVAVKRWQDFTGQKATLESDGRTFEDVAAARYDWKQDASGSYTDAIAAKRAELEASS
jgi:DNA modification methylase